MGKAFAGLSEATSLTAQEEESFRVGAYLALQRKLRGIDLDDLASLTHIPRRSLERLESGAFDGDSDGFVRGFVRTVSVAIGLDADETVARMLHEPRDPGVGQRLSPQRILLSLLLVGGVLMAIALMPGLLRIGGRDRPAPVVAEVSPAAEPAAVVESPVRRDAVRALSESLAGAPSWSSAAGQAERPIAVPPLLPADPAAGSLASPHGGDPH